MRRYLVVIKLICFCLIFTPLKGQTQANKNILPPNQTSGAELNRILEQIRKTKLERTLKKEAKEAEKKQKAPKKAETKQPKLPDATLQLKKIEFTDSTVLSENELKEIIAKYIGTTVSISQLYEIVGKVNEIYRDRGYITAMAVLPPQKIKDGKVQIRLIEGKIGNVIVAGNKYTDTNYLLNRVYLPKGKLLSIKSLDKDLQWFNGTNDVKLRIKLQAGTKPGTTDYYLLAYEPKPDSCNIFSDTAGSDSTGRTRTGINIHQP